MENTSDHVQADRHAKNRRRFAWLLFGVVVIAGLIFNGLIRKTDQGVGFGPKVLFEGARFEEKTIEGEGDDKLVLARVEGILYDDPLANFGAEPGLVPLEKVIRQFDQAKNDPQVKGMIMVVNSPGGTVTASQTIVEKVTELKKAGKKVVVLMRELAASGGYFIAAPADKIVANPSTITGSIGVIFQTANLEELYQKVGYRPITFKAGRLKDLGSPSRPITEEERQIIQQLLDAEHEEFKKVVAESRSLDGAKINQVADGRILSGRQAKELALVDELGNLPKAIEVAKKEAGIEKVRVVEYVTPISFISDLIGFDFFGRSEVGVVLQRLIGQGQLPSAGLMYLWVP